MTDGQLSDGHLTDEQLSSRLDRVSGFGPDGAGHGESERAGQRAGQKGDDHLVSCARCRARMAALEAVRDLVRTPVVPVAPDMRAASIAAVLRESEVPQAGAGRAEGPIPMKVRRRPQVLVGSAAAVLILAAAVGVPLALSGRSTSGGSAGSGAVRSSIRASSGPESHNQAASATTGLSNYLNAPLADLGAVDSVEALGARAATLQPLASTVAQNAPLTTGTPTASGKGGSGSNAGGTLSPTATPTPYGASAKSVTPATPATITLFEHCLSSAVGAAGLNRAVEALATAVFRGAPALVYVFMPASGGSVTGKAAQSVVVATARAGCGVLGTASP